LLGVVQLSTLRPELRAALRGVGPGQVTEVVALPTGFAVLRVESVPGPSVLPDGSNPAGIPGLVATGAVKYTLDVGGLPEAEAVLREFQKPVDWNQDPRGICNVRRASMADAQRMFEHFFQPDMDALRNARPP